MRSIYICTPKYINMEVHFYVCCAIIKVSRNKNMKRSVLHQLKKHRMSPSSSESISFHHCLNTQSIPIFIQETRQRVFIYTRDWQAISINFKTRPRGIILIAIIFFFWIGHVGFGQLTGCQQWFTACTEFCTSSQTKWGPVSNPQNHDFKVIN